MSESAEEVLAPEAWRTLGWTSLAVFMALLDATILFVAFPSIRRSFPEASVADLSWILNAYTIVYAALLVPAGRMADRVGRRRVFLIGVWVFTLGSLACGVAPTPAFIVAGRVLQAVGGAMLTPPSLALVLAAFPRSKRSLAVSLWAAVGALAAAVGPSLGAAIIQFGGWRWAFLLNLPLGAAAVVRGGRVLTESRDSSAGDAPDVIGVGLLILGIGLVALGMVQGRQWGIPLALACVAAGLAVLVFFGLRSRTVSSPALDFSLFASANFRYANLATLVFGAAFSAMWLASVLFLTNVWGYSTLEAGLGMTPGPLAVMLVAPIAGRLGGRYGHRPLLVPGGAVFALAFLTRYLVTSPTPRYLAEWLPALLLSGIGIGLVLPALTGASAHDLPPHRFAVGSGVNQAIRQIGAVLGVGAVIALVGTQHGPGALPAFDTVFLLLALGGISAGVISAAIDTHPGADPSRGEAPSWSAFAATAPPDGIAGEENTSMKGRPMTNSHRSALLDPRSSADSAARAERELNTAIVSADVSASYEEFLAIVDQFYADHVELRSDSSPQPLIGRARLKSLLVDFLAPLHMMAEVGGLSVSVSEKPIASDSPGEQHSQWSLDLVGVTGRAVRVSWSVRRRWKQSRVVGEYHYDHHQEGEALGLSDLRIPTFNGMEEVEWES